MHDKPMHLMDEPELKAVITETARSIEAFKVTLGSYASAVRRRQRAMALLRDKFAVDCRTGRRIRRKGGVEFDLTA